MAVKRKSVLTHSAIFAKSRASTSCRQLQMDQLMPHSRAATWRDDIDAMEFQPADHQGVCMVHRRAFRTLLRATPSPQQCVDFYRTRQDAFQAAARAKVLRASVADTANFHLTSRDVARQLKK